MGIFVDAKFVLSSEFKCDFNVLIFGLIRHELSELHELYKMYPEMEIFHAFSTANSCKTLVKSSLNLTIKDL